MILLRIILLYCLLDILKDSKSYAKIVISRATVSSGENDTSKFHFYNVTTRGEKQFLNFNLTLAAPLDNSVGGIWLLEYAADGKHYVKIRQIKEKYACRAYNAYGGGMWHEIEKSADIPAGVCPIKAGNYVVQDHYLDFSKLTFQALPIGKIKCTIKMFNNNNNNKKNPVYFLGTLLELTNG